MQEIEYYDGELNMSSWFVNGEWYWDGPSGSAYGGDFYVIYYWLDGVYHRDDGPAIVYADGKEYWMLEGEIHRDDGGPAIETPEGDKYWYLNGKYHRDDGPAIETPDGGRIWYQHDKRHRDDGPAIEFANGTKKWFLDDVEFTEEKFNGRLHNI